MSKLPFHLMLLVGILVAACASNKILVPTGGSRADGTVELSYDVGIFQRPVVDWNKAVNTASRRCQAWNYTGAELFGGLRTYCHRYNSYGSCVQATVTAVYQCTGFQQ